MVDGKADEALYKALGDRVGIRRAVAAVTLWQGHASDGLPAVRKLLTDKDLQVRRRVALELAVAGDQDGAVVLTPFWKNYPMNRPGKSRSNWSGSPAARPLRR